MRAETNPYESLDPLPKNSPSLAARHPFVAASTVVSLFFLSLLVFGLSKPNERAFSIAPRLHVFICPYGDFQSIAIANFACTSLIDMSGVESRFNFDALGIHSVSLKWPDYWALALRLHLIYPVFIFACPIGLMLLRRARKQ